MGTPCTGPAASDTGDVVAVAIIAEADAAEVEAEEALEALG